MLWYVVNDHQHKKLPVGVALASTDLNRKSYGGPQRCKSATVHIRISESPSIGLPETSNLITDGYSSAADLPRARLQLTSLPTPQPCRLPCGYWKRITSTANTTQLTSLKARQQVFASNCETPDGLDRLKVSRY